MEALIHSYDPDREYFFVEGCHINELGNTDSDEALSIAQARLEPGKTTRWHWLRDTVERYVLLQGRGSVEVGELPPADVGPGDVVVIPPGVRQRITALGDRDLVFLALCTPRFEVANYVDVQDEMDEQ
ncbi:MAG: cupin domain-containing protein [Pseudomonadota bacterium]